MRFDHKMQHALHTYLMANFPIRCMAPIIAEYGGILVEYSIGEGGNFIVQYRFKEEDICLYWGMDINYAAMMRIKEICTQHGFMVSDV